MPDDRKYLEIPAFFKIEAPIRPRSKISRIDIPFLCLAFCWPRSVPEVSKTTGFSIDTIRGLYFDFRELLLDARYRKWHSFDLQSPYELDWAYSIALDQIVWTCYAACYDNKECQRNFKYKKRKNRECQSCLILRSEPVKNAFDEDFRRGWLRIVDRTERFYSEIVRIRREFGISQEIFKRRVYHQQIVNTARVNSAVVNPDGQEAVDHFKEGPGTVLDLWQTLIRHIEDRGQL